MRYGLVVRRRPGWWRWRCPHWPSLRRRPAGSRPLRRCAAARSSRCRSPAPRPFPPSCRPPAVGRSVPVPVRSPGPAKGSIAALRRADARSGAEDQRLLQRPHRRLPAIRPGRRRTARSRGPFLLQKPGKVRFDYAPPSPIEIISDGSSIAVRDRKLAPRSSTRCRRRRCASCSPSRSTCPRSPVIAVQKDDLVRVGGAGRASSSRRYAPVELMFDAQDLPAEAVDGDRPAGLRHLRRDLQRRHGQASER